MANRSGCKAMPPNERNEINEMTKPITRHCEVFAVRRRARVQTRTNEQLQNHKHAFWRTRSSCEEQKSIGTLKSKHKPIVQLFGKSRFGLKKKKKKKIIHSSRFNVMLNSPNKFKFKVNKGNAKTPSIVFQWNWNRKNRKKNKLEQNKTRPLLHLKLIQRIEIVQNTSFQKKKKITCNLHKQTYFRFSQQCSLWFRCRFLYRFHLRFAFLKLFKKKKSHPYCLLYCMLRCFQRFKIPLFSHFRMQSKSIFTIGLTGGICSGTPAIRVPCCFVFCGSTTKFPLVSRQIAHLSRSATIGRCQHRRRQAGSLGLRARHGFALQSRC